VATFIDNENRFRQDAATVRECPHCGAHAQLIPVATPSYGAIASRRPRQVPLGFYCSACGAPRFARANVRAIDEERVELSAALVEVERAKEHFPVTYLPEEMRGIFEEALACYVADIPNAFASMCRRTLEIAASANVDTHAYRAAFDDIVRIGEIDGATADTLKQLLFEDGYLPTIDAGRSAVLIEVMRDILYQCHVRAAKFHAAMKMRRFFAEETHEKVTSFRRPRGSARSA
jgi:hypothetical protein